ncbi:hypothetical protein [Sphingobium fuliginis]|nr:hypothetical protein [Sphingobium fuliginis]
MRSASAARRFDDLMQRVSELLEEVDDATPAVHLQMVLDVLTGAPIPREIQEAEVKVEPKEAPTLLAR